MIDTARPQNYTAAKTVARCAMSGFAAILGSPTRATPNIGHIGHPRASLMGAFDQHDTMAITQSNTIGHEADGQRTTIDLSVFVDDVPSGTTAELSVTGDRSSYELEFARRDDRWTIEGAGDSAELTAVYSVGETVRKKPERVPSWITAVLEQFDIREVSVRR